MPARIQIDTTFLLQKESSLIRLKRTPCTWNQLGESVLLTPRVTSSVARHAGSSVEPPDHWTLAKDLVHSALSTGDTTQEKIRNRLGNLQSPSTPLLLSTLSLWLAGQMGISVSVTRPMVAAMLYGIAEAGGCVNALQAKE